MRGRFGRAPDVAAILGTGLGALASRVAVEATIDYADLPGVPLSTVESHAGRLLCGTLAGKTVVAMQGRFHRYEGYTLAQVSFPVRVLRALGARVLVVSNASGGMHPLWAARMPGRTRSGRAKAGQSSTTVWYSPRSPQGSTPRAVNSSSMAGV